MRKLKLRLGMRSGVRLSDGTTSIELRLRHLTVTADNAYWEVGVLTSTAELTVSGYYGMEMPLLAAWQGSWIALSGPIVVHVGRMAEDQDYRPEFVMSVPDGTRWEAVYVDAPQ